MNGCIRHTVNMMAVLIFAMVLTGCAAEPPAAESEKSASFYANMYAGNYITQCGDTVFYMQDEGMGTALYVRAAGSGSGTRIAEDVMRYFVTDHYVFYETAADDGFYRMDHNGRHKKNVSGQTPVELVAVGDEIYFTTYDGRQAGNGGGLYRAAGDGTGAQVVEHAGNAYNLFPYEGVLYFCIAADREDGTDTMVDLGNDWFGISSNGGYPMDGSIYAYDAGAEAAAPEKVAGAEHVKRFLIVNGEIFWVGLQLWHMDLSGGAALCVTPDAVVDSAALNFCGGALYCSTNYEQVMRYDRAEESMTVALQQPVSAIWVAEETVYCAHGQTGAVMTIS